MCNPFADDTAIYVSGKTINNFRSKLWVAVNATINWFHTNKLTIIMISLLPCLCVLPKIL